MHILTPYTPAPPQFQSRVSERVVRILLHDMVCIFSHPTHLRHKDIVRRGGPHEIPQLEVHYSRRDETFVFFERVVRVVAVHVFHCAGTYDILQISSVLREPYHYSKKQNVYIGQETKRYFKREVRVVAVHFVQGAGQYDIIHGNIAGNSWLFNMHIYVYIYVYMYICIY